MKRIITIIFVCFWLLLLAVLGGYYLVGAPREEGFSETENRTLAAFPELNSETLFSGEFGESIETYLLDRFWGRDVVIAKSNQIKDFMSVASYEEYLLAAEDTKDPLEEERPEIDIDDILSQLRQPNLPTANPSEMEISSTPSLTPNPPSTDSPTEDSVVMEAPEVTQTPAGSRPLTLTPSPTPTTSPTPAEYPPIEQKAPTNIDDFSPWAGVYMEADGQMTELRSYHRDSVLAVTAVLNQYASLLPENGKLMFTMVPQSVKGNLFVNASHKECLYSNWDEIMNAFGSDNVYALDSAEILSDAICAGEYVYFRTDMHWTPYGSYLAYREMAERAGKVPCDYTEDFGRTAEEPFLGTYYRDNPTSYMKNNADILDILKPNNPLEWRRINGKDSYKLIDFLDFNAKSNDRYTVYLSGPAGPWTYAEVENEETENCLVLMDSFGLGYLPFLTANYKQVHYYDPRYFDASVVGYSVAEMIERYQIQDIYVVVGDLHSFDSSFILTNAKNQLFGN